MPTRVLLAALVLLPALGMPSLAGRCDGCVYTVPPAAVRCVPNGGILVFNSVPPNVPAYWTLFAEPDGARSLRRLDGRLEVFADVEDPGVPGFPGTFDGTVYVGESARFRGVVRRERVRGVAEYADGRRCTFRMRLAFGLGGPRPNAFSCRDAEGRVLAEGALDLQGIRLFGCIRGRATR
jgi:hypothetical protein